MKRIRLLCIPVLLAAGAIAGSAAAGPGPVFDVTFQLENPQGGVVNERTASTWEVANICGVTLADLALVRPGDVVSCVPRSGTYEIT